MSITKVGNMLENMVIMHDYRHSWIFLRISF